MTQAGIHAAGGKFVTEVAGRGNENFRRAGFYWVHEHEILVCTVARRWRREQFSSYQQTRLFLADVPAICYRLTRIAWRGF